MILTEKEAQTKFCHVTMAGTVEGAARELCDASKCMAWRWHDDGSDEQPRRGYCGLAGKPEIEK